MLELFPDTVAIEGGELVIGGVATSTLADEYGTPLVVYCEETVRARARAYTQAAPEALVVYGTKAFPNVALMRLCAGEGLGADVSTLGELELALRADVPPERLVVHGNNKTDEELRRAAGAGAGLVVLDALDEIERAAAAGARRVLVRVTPGVEAETHEAIRTGHEGSKFGLPPDQALAAVEQARRAGLDVAGLHVHVGSQLQSADPVVAAIDRLAALPFRPQVLDLGGGLAVRHTLTEPAVAIPDFVGALLHQVAQVFSPVPRLILEPGRSLVAQAGVTLYRVGVVKRVSAGKTYAAVDGGISDNPRPQLYGARFEALLANRAAEQPSETYAIAGRHCESGDVLIERVTLPAPRRGDLLAVPVTGAYTLAMASNYNGVPRPAAVLVRSGVSRPIRRRETIADLLALEAEDR
jgi:diaminopimelate decarboxylase